LSQFFFSLLLLLEDEALLNLSSHAHFLSCLSLGHVEGFRESGEIGIDGMLPQPASIGSQALVEGDRVAPRIFPIGNARWDIPSVPLLLGESGGRCLSISRTAFLGSFFGEYTLEY
jgi:hypothetical protein